MEEDSEVLLVPHERIGAIIGKAGQTKKDIESKTETKITVDSKEGEVEVCRRGEPIKYFRALRVLKAIARGFSPENAYRLLNDEMVFELIELQDELGKNESRMKAKKGRVIGSQGAAREEIEQDTGAKISVYGKTIGIIGKDEEVDKAKRAVDMLLSGAAHTSVFRSLRKKEGSGEKFEL